MVQPSSSTTAPGLDRLSVPEIVAKAPPDGYLLLMMFHKHTVNESLVPKKPFTLMKDFVGVAPGQLLGPLMVVHPSLPARSVKEFIQLARSKPRGLNYASSGTGTPYTWRANCSKRWHASTSFTCRTRLAPSAHERRERQVEMMTPRSRRWRRSRRRPGARAPQAPAEAIDVMPDLPTVSKRRRSRLRGGRSGSASCPQPAQPRPQSRRLNAEKEDRKPAGRAQDRQGKGRFHDDEPRRIRSIPQRRYREVGEGREIFVGAAP